VPSRFDRRNSASAVGGAWWNGSPPLRSRDRAGLPDNIEVQFKGQDGRQAIRANWLVGCDGMHSVVREQAAIPFEGSAYDKDFILADVEMDWPLELEEVDLFLSEKGLVVVAPLPDNRYRIAPNSAKTGHPLRIVSASYSFPTHCHNRGHADIFLIFDATSQRSYFLGEV
jgi:hypothetical protein